MAVKDFVIHKGKTFTHTLRYEAPPFIYRPITAISQTAPVRITSPTHGLVDGWRVAVVSAKGMTQINAENDPPAQNDYRRATVIDANTIELNNVNAADFKAYVSGGYLQFLTPVDLTGLGARMSIKDRVGGRELLRLDSSNSRIVIDLTKKTIKLIIDAATTAAITWKKGVYDLELYSAGLNPVVTLLLSGVITVEEELTAN